MPLAPRIHQLLTALCHGLHEKDEVMRLTLLSALAGESIFLLGKPGVAKSLVARRLKYAFHQGKAFEYLMSRFSTPDEIFGPVSVSKLKDADRYERVTRGYLPEADIVFLDEIWKAGPSIQNALLTILNEKIYKNGEYEIQAPIKALISASNELPAQGEGLEALWDRFLLRYIVQPIAQKNSFNAMIADTESAYGDTIPEALKIKAIEYSEWTKAIDAVQLPEEIFTVIHAIRHYLNEYNATAKNTEWYISDRRWRKIVRLLRASAFFNGRNTVDLSDCFLIAYCIWETAEQEKIAQEMVAQAIEKHGFASVGKADDIQKLIQQFQLEIDKGVIVDRMMTTEVPRLFNGKYYGFKINNNFYEIDEQAYQQLNKHPQWVDVHIYYGMEQKKMIRSSRPNHLIIIGELEFSGVALDTNEPVNIYNQKEYKLETELKQVPQKTAVAPDATIAAEWDLRAGRLTGLCANLRQSLDAYINKSANTQHLFIDTNRTLVIQQSIQKKLKEIDKMELDIKQAVFRYKNL